MWLPLLGGLTARQFLRRHWQKKPLLIRQALPGFTGPLAHAAVLRLATNADIESRLVSREAGRWQLIHGPFARSMLAALPERNWTLLIQGLNTVNVEADALLHRFDFIPHARQDDVMVSYAVPGGGVGPHLDSYDVFLLQGAGRRRWRIGPAADARFKPGLPLKILRNFRPDQEWTLEPGDMLYLPPGTAHEGVAETECFTYSIGFRAPSHQELGGDFLDYLRDTLELEGMLEDPGLKPASAPGALPPAMLAQAERALAKLRWNRDTVADFLARNLSEPKPHLVFTPPASPLGTRAFDRALERHGIALDARSRMIYRGSRVYINGEPVSLEGGTSRDTTALRLLADRRRLADCAGCSAAFRALMRSWYLYGFAHIDGSTHP